MNITTEKTDIQIRNDVLSELKYEPSIRSTDVDVSVQHGIVTLKGSVSSYGERWEAVRVAQRVASVAAITNDIIVNLPESSHRIDEDIASIAAKQIEWFLSTPIGAVEVTVKEGWLTLDGEVEWEYQRKAAQNFVQHLLGVKGVSNLIIVKPSLTVAGIETDIKLAFQRSALLDAHQIHVEISDNKVILQGKVRNYGEREEAERVAWAAPGVLSVENQITMQWSKTT
jgi:osmotically-inducible protein OsmY